jgi:hypothetical protein
MQVTAITYAPHAVNAAALGTGIVLGLTPGAPPEIVNTGNPYFTVGQVIGTSYSNRDSILNSGSEMSNALNNIFDSINNPHATPPSMWGSIILSVPSPQSALPSKPPGRG